MITQTIINVQGDEQEAFEIYADETRAQTVAFCFDEQFANLIAAAPQLLAACGAQHEAIDRLFALLIAKDESFFPSKSGQPWEALKQGNAVIESAKGTL